MKTKSRVCLILLSMVLIFLINSCSKFEYLSGNEVKGFADGSVIDAKFNNPTAMDVDDSGNLYVIDQINGVEPNLGLHNTIRKITPGRKVSTFVKLNAEENAIDSIKIKDNFLYFANRTSVKRLNLSGDIKIENIVGTNESKDIIGDFVTARFSQIESFVIDRNDNLFIADSNRDGRKIKKANISTKKVEAIKFEIEGSNAVSGGELLIEPKDKYIINSGTIQLLNINPKTNLLHFCLSNTFSKKIFQINSKNQIIDLRISKVLDSFTFDNEGNMYLISIDSEKLLKISIENKLEEISGFGGILNIKKDSNFPEFGGWSDTHLAMDNNNKILYMSTSENKIFKLNLGR
jgi:hypothetical protein